MHQSRAPHVHATGVEKVWTHEGRFLRSVQGADSWKPMDAARAYAREHSQGLYEHVFLRREMRFVASGVLVLVVGLAMSLWRYGLHDHLEYLQVLSFIARRGESFCPNQSINGLLNRALFNGSNLEWQAHEFAPVNPVVYAGTMIALVALGAASLRRPEQSAGIAIDLAMATLWLTLTAPVAWEHHYGILVPIYAAVSPSVIAQRPLGRFTGPAIALSYLVAANYFQFTNRFADTWLNPLQSYLLGAALLLWLLLYRSVHAPVVASASFDRQELPRASRAALAGLSVWRRPFRSRSS